jgi:hypothetical protein
MQYNVFGNAADYYSMIMPTQDGNLLIAGNTQSAETEYQG